MINSYLVGRMGWTGLRWDLVDQAPIRSRPTWPARHNDTDRVADTSTQGHKVDHNKGQATQRSGDG